MAGVATGDLVKHLEPGLKTIFHGQLKRPQSFWKQFATKVPSDQPTEDYSWFGEAPMPRQVDDERQPKALREFSISLENVEYESSIKVRRALLDDERYGQLKTRIRDLARNVNRFFDIKLAATLESGFTENAYDGQFFFDSDHSEGESGTQSNLLTSALTPDAYQTARKTMHKFKDDTGEVLGVTPGLLVVPPDLEKTARQILEAEIVAEAGDVGGKSNVYRNSANLMVNPFLTDSNNWYLMDVSQPVKPLILQERIAPEFGSLEKDSEGGFHRFTYYYGTYWRGNFGFGRWQTALGSKVT